MRKSSLLTVLVLIIGAACVSYASDALRHKDVGEQITKDEWEAEDTHYLSDYASGDMLYSDVDGKITRLPIATPGQVITVATGTPVPVWVDQSSVALPTPTPVWVEDGGVIEPATSSDGVEIPSGELTLGSGDGSYSLPASRGGSGQLLTSDGAGGSSWAALTDDQVPDTITVEEADHAATADSATNAAQLGGTPAADYATEAELEAGLAGKSDSGHDHAFSEITGTATDAQVDNDLVISSAGSVDAGALKSGTVPSARLSLTDGDVPSALTLSGSTINGSVIGGSVPAAGSFTTLSATGATFGNITVTGTLSPWPTPVVDPAATPTPGDVLVYMSPRYSPVSPGAIVTPVPIDFESASNGDVLVWDGPGGRFEPGDSVNLNSVTAVTVTANSVSLSDGTGLADKANAADVYTKPEVDAALDGKADDDHTHALQDLGGAVTDAQVPNSIEIDHAATADSATNAAQLGGTPAAGWASAIDGKADDDHTHGLLSMDDCDPTITPTPGQIVEWQDDGSWRWVAHTLENTTDRYPLATPQAGEVVQWTASNGWTWATLNKADIGSGGTLGFDWPDGDVSDTLTVGSGGSVDKGALKNTGTLGFDWSNDEVADNLTISSSGSVDVAALSGAVDADTLESHGAEYFAAASHGHGNADLTGVGDLSFDWDDTEIANSLTIVGGSVNDSPVGASTPSTGAFTTLSANGAATFGTFLSETADFIVRSKNNNALVVDCDVNRVGVLTSTPASALDVNGVLTANYVDVDMDLDVAGDLTIGGDLTVTGTIDGDLAGGATVSGDLTVANSGALTVADDCAIGGALSVSGAATFGTFLSETADFIVRSKNNNALVVDCDVNRVGVLTSTPASALDVNGVLTANYVDVDMDLDVAGDLTIGGDLTVTGDMNVGGTWNFGLTQPTLYIDTAHQWVGVNTNTYVPGRNFDVNGEAYFQDNVEVSGDMEISGDVLIGENWSPFSQIVARSLTVDYSGLVDGAAWMELRGRRASDASGVAGISFQNIQSLDAYDQIAQITANRDTNDYGGQLRLRTMGTTAGAWNTGVYIRADGYVGIETSSPSSELDVDGDITCDSLTETSDENLKTDIAAAELPGLDAVTSITARQWHWRDEVTSDTESTTAPLSYGFVAQEVEAVAPQAVDVRTLEIAEQVVFDEDTGTTVSLPATTEEMRVIRPTVLTAILWRAVQEQQAEIDQLKGNPSPALEVDAGVLGNPPSAVELRARNVELEARVDALESRLDALEARFEAMEVRHSE